MIMETLKVESSGEPIARTSRKPWVFYLVLGILVFSAAEWYVINHLPMTEAWKKMTLGAEFNQAQKSLWTAFNGKKGITGTLWESLQTKVEHLEKLDREVT